MLKIAGIEDTWVHYCYFYNHHARCIYRCRSLSMRACVCVCGTNPNLSGPTEMRSLQCSCLILLFSGSVLWAPTHYLLPQSSWKKIYLMLCQEVFFFPFSVRLSCRLLSYSNNQTCPCTMISRSLSGTQTQRGETGQELPMSESTELPLLLWFHWIRWVTFYWLYTPSAGGSAVF